MSEFVIKYRSNNKPMGYYACEVYGLLSRFFWTGDHENETIVRFGWEDDASKVVMGLETSDCTVGVSYCSYEIVPVESGECPPPLYEVNGGINDEN